MKRAFTVGLVILCLALLACGGSSSNTASSTQDDTAYVQGMIDSGQTIPAGNYVLRSTIIVTKSVIGAGPGTHFTFQPSPPLQQCQNDRAFTTPCDSVYSGLVARPWRQISGAIALNATSFQATDDVSDLQPGDWLIITEKDNAVSEVVIIDWAQVSSAVGNTVNVTAPFRTTFPNLRAWNPLSGGLGFLKAVNWAQNVTFSNFNLNVVNSDPNNGIPGISVFAAQHVQINNVNVTDQNGQALYSYLSQDLRLSNCSGNSGPTLNEFAATVDLQVSNCDFRSSGDAGFGLDFGTGFFTVTNNSSTGYGIGFYMLYGVHDGTVQGLSAPYVCSTTNAVGILARGTQNVTVTNANLIGGQGAQSVGISFGPAYLEVPLPSSGNILGTNTFGEWSMDLDPTNQL